MWRQRYQVQRVQMIPDIARWLKLLRFFHPRRMEDHWQDQFGNPLPKLYDSEGLSVEIYNVCRPIIEVYGSLLAGQKPMPFTLDVLASDTQLKSELFRAEAQEKLITHEMMNMRVPLHFLDFCTSVVLFGIGYAWSWIDPSSRRLHTQTISWPGDVLPQWGSNRYGRGGDALESVILAERLPIDAARRLYPGVEFLPSWPDITFRPDTYEQMILPGGTTQILKVWWRWGDGKRDQVGYSEIAYDGTKSGDPEVLFRDDESGYPDIPVRWASRFQTPGEPPHRAAGVLDDVIGINTEYNERLSAFADLLMKFVYPKLKGKGFNVNNVPRLTRGQNVYPMTLVQDLALIQEVAGGSQGMFDSFLGRLENHMLMNAGLSRLLMGSMPPGETSGEALNNLLHASISRLEVVRTPIQWAWVSMIQDIWVPLLYQWGRYKVKDGLTGKSRTVTLKDLFDVFEGVTWVWPDVTPRDALRAIGIAMDLGKAGYLADESVMARASVAAPMDELEKIRKDKQDPILHPDAVRLSKLVEMMSAPGGPQVKVSLSGQLSPEEIQDAAEGVGIEGAAPTEQSSQGAEKLTRAVKDENQKAQAAKTPTRSEADNAPVRQGSADNAAQGSLEALGRNYGQAA